MGQKKKDKFEIGDLVRMKDSRWLDRRLHEEIILGLVIRERIVLRNNLHLLEIRWFDKPEVISSYNVTTIHLHLEKV